MNVKPGDLARVVAPFVMCGRGSFVRVVRRSVGDEMLSGTLFEDGSGGRVSWVCEGWVRWEGDRLKGPMVAIDDGCLRRIDPGERADEVLTLVQRKFPEWEGA